MSLELFEIQYKTLFKMSQIRANLTGNGGSTCLSHVGGEEREEKGGRQKDSRPTAGEGETKRPLGKGKLYGLDLGSG